MTDSDQSNNQLTPSWEVHDGANCSCCGKPLEGRITVRLGNAPSHEMMPNKARGLGEALIKAADRIDAQVPR